MTAPASVRFAAACLFILLAGAGAGAAAGAAQVSAVRYVDAQGVEVIVNRDAAKAPETSAGSAATMSADASARGRAAAGAGVRAARSAAPGAIDPKLKIDPAEQNKRDQDRIGILQQELDLEAQKYAALMQKAQAVQAAQARPGADKPSAADAQRITEELYDHQQNIQSLNAELRRARAAR